MALAVRNFGLIRMVLEIMVQYVDDAATFTDQHEPHPGLEVPPVKKMDCFWYKMQRERPIVRIYTIRRSFL